MHVSVFAIVSGDVKFVSVRFNVTVVVFLGVTCFDGLWLVFGL